MKATIATAAARGALLAGVFLAGCSLSEGPPPTPAEATSMEPAPVEVTQDQRDEQIRELEALLEVRTQRFYELSRREEKLRNEVNQLRFENEQLRAQVAALGDIARQRDQLQARISQLESPTTTAPAQTQPAP